MMCVGRVIGTGAGVARPVVLAHVLVNTKVLIEVIEHWQGLEAVAEGAEVAGDGGHGVRVEREGGVRGAESGQGTRVRHGAGVRPGV